MRPIKVRYLEGERGVVGGLEANKGMCYLEGERRVVGGGGCEANKGTLPGR